MGGRGGCIYWGGGVAVFAWKMVLLGLFFCALVFAVGIGVGGRVDLGACFDRGEVEWGVGRWMIE